MPSELVRAQGTKKQIGVRTLVFLLELASAVALHEGGFACWRQQTGEDEEQRKSERSRPTKPCGAPVPPSPTRTSLKDGTPSGTCIPGSAMAQRFLLGAPCLKRNWDLGSQAV